MTQQRPRFPAQIDLNSGRPTSKAGVAAKSTPVKAVPVQATPVKVLPVKTTSAKSIPARPAMPVAVRKPAQSHGMDSGAVRARMVEKLAAQGVTSPMVLAAMNSVERHRFVDSALVNQAYEDTSLPIGLGQTISKPSVVARMIELLLGAPGLVNGDGTEKKLGRVLEIGTGCGYQAALLSKVASDVYSIERLRGLHEKARENLRLFRVANLHLLLGDGKIGYEKGGPYAAIIAAAGGEDIPQAWVDQLAMGGRIVAPTVAPYSDGKKQVLVVIDKLPQGLKQTVLEAVNFVPLKSGLG